MEGKELEIEIERRKIIDRLLSAEFGHTGKVCTDPPVTPPDRWESVLGEPIDPNILAEASKLANATPTGMRIKFD